MKKEEKIKYLGKAVNILVWIFSFTIILSVFLNFAILLLLLLGKFGKEEDIKNFVLITVGTYISAMYIIKEIDKEIFDNLKYLLYLFLPSFFSIFLAVKSPIEWLYFIPALISLFLVFLMCICYFKPSTIKKVCTKIWYNILKPLVEFLKNSIHKK